MCMQSAGDTDLMYECDEDDDITTLGSNCRYEDPYEKLWRRCAPQTHQPYEDHQNELIEKRTEPELINNLVNKCYHPKFFVIAARRKAPTVATLDYLDLPLTRRFGYINRKANIRTPTSKLLRSLASTGEVFSYRVIFPAWFKYTLSSLSYYTTACSAAVLLGLTVNYKCVQWASVPGGQALKNIRNEKDRKDCSSNFSISISVPQWAMPYVLAFGTRIGNTHIPDILRTLCYIGFGLPNGYLGAFNPPDKFTIRGRHNHDFTQPLPFGFIQAVISFAGYSHHNVLPGSRNSSKNKGTVQHLQVNRFNIWWWEDIMLELSHQPSLCIELIHTLLTMHYRKNDAIVALIMRHGLNTNYVIKYINRIGASLRFIIQHCTYDYTNPLVLFQNLEVG